MLIIQTGCFEKRVINDKTVVCIIGTEHDSSEYVNPQILYQVLEKVKPDVILCELEQKIFTGNTYNLADYPDLLLTNENISTYRYQQKYEIDLRPYEIEGRNDYYNKSSFFERQQHLFSEIMNAYKNDSLSIHSRDEWNRLLKTVPILDISRKHTLEMLNSELFVCYSEAKDMILYNTLISVCRRDFPQYLADANEFKAYWDKRNNAMTANILKWCDEYAGKVIVVLTGQQHKSQLLNNIHAQLDKYDLEIKEFWEFEAQD